LICACATIVLRIPAVLIVISPREERTRGGLEWHEARAVPFAQRFKATSLKAITSGRSSFPIMPVTIL
jgi:hypothetical protein